MASAHAAQATDQVEHPSDDRRPSPPRALRWSYRRNGESLTCELALTAACDAYELRVSPPRFPFGPASELFDDAICAFQRHARFERELFEEGLMLEAFEHGGQRAA